MRVGQSDWSNEFVTWASHGIWNWESSIIGSCVSVSKNLSVTGREGKTNQKSGNWPSLITVSKDEHIHRVRHVTVLSFTGSHKCFPYLRANPFLGASQSMEFWILRFPLQKKSFKNVQIVRKRSERLNKYHTCSHDPQDAFPFNKR